ncbi:ATP-dependent RNA helicase DOB1 [Angomonas deanei]|nr:ATP-dependent RNA helicase DOB1 [Angomonas deanei]|eukprot:EPY37606.1 ATP-dependent RNA helicase DOB1 [Angomonas deanei]
MTEKEGGRKRPRRESSPAFTFPYELDTFQKDSIDALEEGDSVLVSAHTSAGKTTVALYAIAKALREKKRVIYTSPIKALSNQKFREFGEKFDSVGLMTGDTTIKTDSDCLVMTTEILRSMLYRGTEMLREVGCVVFDEVHYMRDKARGVVWEETISLLPEGCQYVFLSATIPNAREFADWVESIHPTTKVHVIYTDYRPVPLQHYIYPSGADGIFLIVDEKGKFRDDNFSKAITSMGAGTGTAQETGNSKGIQRNKKNGGDASMMEIIKLVMDRNMYPVIVFSFAKAQCERNAMALARLNFNNTEEDNLVVETFENAMESLGEEDRKIPTIEHLLPLLRRGIGVHHSGLLPILKEVVEILFQAGLVKVLFSTETFSMGLNMPARTVVFTSVKKFDGEDNRYLTGGEYIQMSGRAGRRGLDRVGVVIAMIDEAVEPDTLKRVTGGGADVLLSSFHLTYNMVLNLLRVEDVDPEFMMKRSFAQFQRLRDKPALEEKKKLLTEAVDRIQVENEEVFSQYLRCKQLIHKRQEEIAAIAKQPKHLKNWVQAGRFVRIVRLSDGVVFHWGICRAFSAKSATADVEDPKSYTITVSVICNKVHNATDTITPCHVTEYNSISAELYTVTFDFCDIDKISTLKINLPPQPDSEQGRTQIIQTLSKLHKSYQEEVPILTLAQMGIDDPQVTKLQTQTANLEKQLAENALVEVAHPGAAEGL